MVQVDESLLKAGGVSVTQENRSDGLVIFIEIVRERALNALLSETFHAFEAVLNSIAIDKPTQVVFLGGERAFSAGGDVRSLRSKILNNGEVDTERRREMAERVLRIEYDFLARLAKLGDSKSVETVAIANGIAFGAGFGLFRACKRRIVTSRAVLSMPECRIGLVPDCGATHFLTSLPGCVGMYAALTGARISAIDALALGLATHAAPVGYRGESLTGKPGPDIKHHIAAGGNGNSSDENHQSLDSDVKQDEEHILGKKTDLTDPNSVLRRGIDDAFSHNSLQSIIARLEEMAQSASWATAALNAMHSASPRALAETFKIMREGYDRSDGLEKALQRELVVESELAVLGDFEEGVRAALIDKDNQPRWQSYNFNVED